MDLDAGMNKNECSSPKNVWFYDEEELKVISTLQNQLEQQKSNSSQFLAEDTQTEESFILFFSSIFHPFL